MQKITIIILILFLTAICSFGQEKEEQKKNLKKDSEKSLKESMPNLKKDKFVDFNGDGINDKGSGIKGNRPMLGRDKFIDRDGDGINDNRVKGMGWGNKGRHKPFGKHRR